MATTKKSFSFKKALKGIFVFPVSPRPQFRRLIIATLVLFLGVAAYHAYFFHEVETGALFKSAGEAPTVTSVAVNEKKLTLVLARFEDKEKAREGAMTTLPLVAEPSK